MTLATCDDPAASGRMQFVFNPGNYPDRQFALQQFSRFVKAAVKADTEQSFNHVQLVLMLLELAKNTFDHSSGVGVLEMQLPAKGTPLLVSYRDSGAPFDWEACSVFGHSTKTGNGVNYGMGLAILKQGCECSSLRLTVERLEDCTQFRFQGPRA